MADETTGDEGATPPEPDPTGATPGGQQRSDEGATPDTPLGEAGRQALEKERATRREAERKASEYRNRIAELEDATKLATIGVPRPALWEYIGASPQQIARWREEGEPEPPVTVRETVTVPATAAQAQAINSGTTPPPGAPVPAPSPTPPPSGGNQ